MTKYRTTETTVYCSSLRGQITSVLLFDTDNDGEGMLKKNIEKLRELPNIRDVICIPQVKNLEDELCYSCQLRDIRELTNSKSKSDVSDSYSGIYC